MSLSPGQKVGPYEIVAPLGAGGMGEVYHAHDSRLGRDVAIKVPAEQFSPRFKREARAIAALNHPNICTLYDVSDDYLVMELIEGETLRGPVPLEIALKYARQIADALEAAHEKGIIHRDLKPGNIKVRPDGTVKVLDFGLATIAEEASPDEPIATLATKSMSPTQAGQIIGTPAYMAPEQARGTALDKRADIWAFGAVLYELVTGKRAFTGHTATDLLASIVKDQPDISALPPRLRVAITRCLSKEPTARWGSMGDVRWALEEGLRQVPDPHPNVKRLSYLPWIMAGLFALVGPAVWFLKPKPDAPLLQMEINAPEGTTMGAVSYGQLELSPDGRKVAFNAAGSDGISRIWLRSLDASAAVPLAGTEGALRLPFWSPDSRWVGFNAKGKLSKIDVSAGGPPQTLCECVGGFATWNSEGTILFTALDKPIQRISASGDAKPSSILTLDKARDENRQVAPYFLPDGRHFVYLSFAKETGIVLASLDGGPRRFLFPASASTASYVPNPGGGGWLLYMLRGELFARPFDARKGELTGPPSRVANSLADGPSWSSSTNGVLAFRRTRGSQSQLTWFNREGKRLGTVAEAGDLGNPRISPDQNTVVFVRTDERNSDIWLFDVARNTSSRFTSSPGTDDHPIWSPDGNRLIYHSTQQSDEMVLERAANAIGPDNVLVKGQDAVFLPTGLSADGQWLAATEATAGLNFMWLLSQTDHNRRVRLGLGNGATVSPNGKWLLYTSQGRVFVQSMPEEVGANPRAAGKWQVSMTDGQSPVWRGDGKEIFYFTNDGKLMAAPVEGTETDFRPGIARPLFQTRVTLKGFRDYDVTPDGKRFLINVPMADTGREPISVIVNWPKLLKK